MKQTNMKYKRKPYNIDEVEIILGEVHIIAERCKGCGLCIIKCPHDALRYEIVRPPEYLKPPSPPDSAKSGRPVNVIPVWGHYDLK